MEIVPVLRFLLGFAVLACLGAPVAAIGFRAFPHRGARFAIPTAMLPFAVVVFWIGHISFGPGTVFASLALLVGAAGLAYKLGGRPDWQTVATGYGVFVLGFIVFVAVRTARPGITPVGGEQFLHFGLLKALERAPSLPPEDAWYAGESLRYYYGGHLQIASVAMLTGVKMRYAFNLGLASFFGILVVVAYGLGSTLATNQNISRRLGGWLCVGFVALAGGTTTAIRLVTPLLPGRIGDMVGQAAFGFVATRFYGGDLQEAIVERTTFLEWSWWYARYVVPGTLQEVPFYSFVKADLHGHTLSTGYVLFAGAVAYAYYSTPEAEHRRRGVLLFGGLGVTAGVFGFMNTWALPTAAGLAVLTVGAAPARPETLLPGRLRFSWRGEERPTDRGRRAVAVGLRLAIAGGAGVLVLLIGVGIAAPFLLLRSVPPNDGIGFLPPRSPLGPFLVIYGGLLTVFTLYLACRLGPLLRGTSRRGLVMGATVLLAGMGTAILLDFPVLAVTAPLLIGAWVSLRSDPGDFGLVLLVAGIGLLLSFEFVHARLPLTGQPRWNTSLKVAVQAWTLGAAGAAGAAAGLITRAQEWGMSSQSPNVWLRRNPDGAIFSATTLSWVVVITVGLIISSSLLFPVLAVGQEVGSPIVKEEYAGSVDGWAALERERPQEAAAIRWLDDRSGTPTIVEAPGPTYGWTSPASTFTGLPTVIGWDHQAEYRGQEAYDRRVARVDSIYTGPWSQAAWNLSRYDVRYVYVGPNERERYGDRRQSFDHPSLALAFQNDAVRIYRVDQERL